MNNDFRTVMTAALSATALTAAIIVAPAYAAANTTTTVAAAIAANPEMIGEALNALQARAAAAEQSKAEASLAPVARAVIAGDRMVGFVGNPKAAKHVVEFFDYNCGFCKRFSRNTVTPLANSGKVMIHLVQTPILGPGSRRMSEFAAAAMLQGRFAKAHEYLIEQHAPAAADADKLKPALIAAAGLDRVKFEKALKDGSAAKIVDHNAAISEKAGVSGTPMIYAGGRSFRGMTDLQTITSIL